MKKSQTFLFILRIIFYFSVLVLILIHPGVSVSFDRIGVIQWFVIIPLLALIAFLPHHRLTLRNRCIFAAAVLLPLSIWAGGFGVNALQPFAAGFIGFTLTFLLFYHSRWGKVSALEPFFLTWVCLRLLALSRSGEDIAGYGSPALALTQFILVWTGVVFLLHSVVVYLCLYPNSTGRAGREGVIFFFASLGILLVVLVVLPPDFVRNAVIENLHPDRIPERIVDDNERGVPREGGRRQGRRTIPNTGDDGQPGLRGISEHNWRDMSGRGRGTGSDGENRQYMVKIVASEREPVYMGNVFRGQLDPAAGFLVSINEPMNHLVNQRFFASWFSNDPELYAGRQLQDVFSLSTLPQKYLPYRPVVIDPTILNENAGPLRYVHQVVSSTHLGDPLLLVNTPSRHLSDFEKSVLASYLEITLEQNDKDAFNLYLNNALTKWRSNRSAVIRTDHYLNEIFADGYGEPVNEYLETIIAILVSFSEYQYNLNYDDDYSIESLKHFLFNSAEGDCVEFSNTLALLGRLAGIPSRVVTGYLAAEGLQTPAHLRGIFNLRTRIPVLQRFPFDNLYMVTNLHGHSWTQFFIPDYGWLDFEATSFAIPPVGMGDFNNWDVVIPMINERQVFSQVRKFPWRAVFRAFVIMAITALVCAYTLRYGREIYLYACSRSSGYHNYRDTARSLYLLLLTRLAADGNPIKPASKTAHEYSELFPLKHEGHPVRGAENSHFKTFANYYSELCWRKFDDSTEVEKRLILLRHEYRQILDSTRRRGIHRWFIRIFSLKGLAYL
jgi:hypothetical protein